VSTGESGKFRLTNRFCFTSADEYAGKWTLVVDGGEIAAGVAELKEKRGIVPGLAVILVGDNPASVSYVTAKEKACAEAGMLSREIRLAADTTEDELLSAIAELNADSAIHGILVQLPLPKGFDEKKVINSISPDKDVDGFTPVNVGRMMIGEECFLPCTPHGIIKLIEFSGMDLNGKHAVVIGRSNIVGKPVAALLARKETNATVTLCHTGTRDIAAFTRQADVVVVAAGRPNTLSGDMLKPGAVVIDVGVNRIPDESRPKGFRLAGDADFDSCAAVASAITPVPGGVGPMTITMLLWNTLESAKR
jgi:methylenetetrahydrofolate dehydrogenase (NADP+)/methenyltetrahydrofolate cyclohydrolase